MPHLLEVQDLTTVFAGDYGSNISVDHVSFHVDRGEVVCLVGESGCGKSVTSLSIMGLLGRGGAVKDGSVLFENKNLLTMTEKDIATTGSGFRNTSNPTSPSPHGTSCSAGISL